MNIGLIGYGYWGKNIYRNLINSAQIDSVYILDINFDKFKQNKKLLIYTDPIKFFNKKDIDAFIISTPTATHYKYLKECLKINKKCLCYKTYNS